MSETSKSSWFKGIKGRLLVAAVLPLIGFGILSTVSYKGISKIAELLNVSNETIIPTFDAIGDLDGSRHRCNAKLWSATSASLSADERKEALAEAKTVMGDLKKAGEFYGSTPMEGEELKRWQETKPIIEDYLTLSDKAYKLIQSQDPQQNKEAEALLVGSIKSANDKLNTWVDFLNDMYKKQARESSKDSVDTQKSVVTVLLAVALLSSLLIFGILIWIASKTSSTVSAVAVQLSHTASEVVASVDQLKAAGQSLASSSSEAAASMQETVASLDEMTSMVKLGSSNAKQAAELAITSCDSAEGGAKEIQNLIQAMNQISTSSKKIEEIISVIDDIAFQTNLLALNAAVEAARAGEQGKGFAVVAEAVRALAHRSSSSAKDIASLIKDSVSQIAQGSDIADKSGTILANIVSSIKKVSDLNNEIATASQEQSQGITQISKAMSQLDQAGQLNATSAEQIAATSLEINNLAMNSRSLTGDLNQIVLGEQQEFQVTQMKSPNQFMSATRAQQQAENLIPFEKPKKTEFAKVGDF